MHPYSNKLLLHFLHYLICNANEHLALQKEDEVKRKIT